MTDANLRPWRAFGTWMATEVDGCTCAGFPPYGHEPHCGYEPMFQVTAEADAVAAAHNAAVAAAEARGRQQGWADAVKALHGADEESNYWGDFEEAADYLDALAKVGLRHSEEGG